MGTLQLSELRDEIISHHGERDDLTSARLNRVINLMQERMARAYDFEELGFSESGTLSFTSTPADDRFLAFSSLSGVTGGVKEVLSFTLPTNDGRGRKLKGWNPRTFDRHIPDPEFEAAGIPSHYTQWREKFELWRIPDQAYAFLIRGYEWPATLSGDTEKSTFDRKDDMIIMLAVSYLYNSQGQYERAGRFFGIFSSLWKDAVSEDINKPDRDLVSPAGAADSSHLTGQYWLDPFQDRMPR